MENSPASILSHIKDYDDSINSPYMAIIKNAKVSNVFNNSISDDDDFKKSKQTKRVVSKMISSKSKKSTKMKKTRLPKTLQKSNLVKNYGISLKKTSSFDLEHLSLATALSKSLHSDNEEYEDNNRISFSASQDSVMTLRSNLAKFGFKTSSPSNNNSRSKSVVDFGSKENKRKEKFKFITPILYIRTEEDRKRNILHNVNKILSENFTQESEITKVVTDEKLYSEKLLSFQCKSKSLFNQIQIENFYVQSLCFSPSKKNVGQYLKNWKEIPGRERSPSPEKLVEFPEVGKHEENVDNIKNLDNTCNTIKESCYFISKSQKRNLSTECESISNDNCSKLRKLIQKCDNLVNNINKSPVQQLDVEMVPKPIPIKHEISHFNVSNKIQNKLTSTDLITNKNSRSISPELFESSDEEIENLHLQNTNYSECFNRNSKSDFELRHETVRSDISIPMNISPRKSFNVTEYVVKMLNNQSDTSVLHDLGNEEITDDNKLKEYDPVIKESVFMIPEENQRHNLEENDELLNPLNESIYNNSKTLIYNHSDIENLFDYNNKSVENVYDKKEQNCADLSITSDKKSENIIEINLCDESNDSLSNYGINIYENKLGLGVTSFSEIEDELPMIKVKRNKDKTNKNASNLICTSNSEAQILGNETTTSSADKNEKIKTDSVLKPLQKSSNNEENEIISLPCLKKSEDQNCDEKNEFSESFDEENNCGKNDEISTPLTKTPNQNEKNEFSESFDEENNCGKNGEISTPLTKTPNQNFEIKLNNITPMINYDDLSTPEITKKLEEIGLKPLKRKRGAQFLKYVYESTHPYMKDAKYNINEIQEMNPEKKIKVTSNSNSESIEPVGSVEIIGDSISEKKENLIFERRRPSKKILSCAVPLHIAWFNFVSSNPKIREHILLYEPLPLENINASLQEQGFKYHKEDLMNFLDKKCINIRYDQNKSRRKCK